MTRLDIAVAVALALSLGSIVAVALPALRETARRKQCSDNLRAIGAALHSYHDVCGKLPPAAFWQSTELEIGQPLLGDTKFDRDSIRAIRANWAILLLPHLGASSLADNFRCDRSIAASVNEVGRSTECATMKCPSDLFASLDNRYVVTFSDGSQAAFARGNYGINGGSQSLWIYPGYLSEPAPNGSHMSYDARSNHFMWWGSGIAGFNKCFSLGEISNGLATTVAIDEVRAGISELDPRGAWSLGRIGSSVTWAHGVNGDDCGPNNQSHDADDILMGKQVHRLIGANVIAREEMPFCDHCNDGLQATSRSKHPGGVNTLMVDGAVRFFSNNIDGGLWQVMHSRETPKEILADRLEGVDVPGEKPSENEASTRNVDGVGRLSTSIEERAQSAKELTNSIGIRFRLIPAGEFTMGLPDKNDHYPYPPGSVPHRVILSNSFYLGVHEVTQAQYQRVMGDNPSWYRREGPGRAERPLGDTSRFPVESVTWFQAQEFCRHLTDCPEEIAAKRTYRLPTEAEWEYACREGSREPFVFNSYPEPGKKSGVIAGMQSTSNLIPVMPVGSFSPNAFGLYDTCGNVFEWVADWHEDGYYARSPLHDPQGPDNGYLKVVRGWYWRYFGTHCKWEYLVTAPWQKSQFIGFRVVCVTAPSIGTAR